MEIKKLAIVTITSLQVIAFIMGYDSALYGTVIAIIAGLAGYELGKEKTKSSY